MTGFDLEQRRQILESLAKRGTGELGLFFTALGLGESFESPGVGWGRAKRISAAMTEAERQGITDTVLATAQRHFGIQSEGSASTDRPGGMNVPTCFVIQPFDNGPFDKRFDDVYAKAIGAAGLEAYRVDRDPRASIPIDAIASQIRAADVCLADITLDNPNVWFELGLAISAGKQVVLVCENRRERFPFDIQHRSVIRYRTESSSDFETLGDEIEARLKAALDTAGEERALRELSPLAPTEGLAAHEQAFLVLAAQQMDSEADSIPSGALRQSMQRAGFNDLAVTLAYRSLGKRRMIEVITESTYEDEPYLAYRVLEAGFDWLEGNRDKLQMRADGVSAEPEPPTHAVNLDDIPF